MRNPHVETNQTCVKVGEMGLQHAPNRPAAPAVSAGRPERLSEVYVCFRCW